MGWIIITAFAFFCLGFVTAAIFAASNPNGEFMEKRDNVINHDFLEEFRETEND